MCSAMVLALKPKEISRVDTTQIAVVYANLSNQAAQQVVARAMSELALFMATMAEQIAAHNLGDMQRRLKRLERMALNLGLQTLQNVCTDLAICLDQGDNTAFSAVWARMLRVADSTLAVETKLQDLSEI